ncbi:chromatin-silencing protein [Maudiozyma humilis]|uniref:Chromatin-silencing protein n=1 Tax=Maudiozyma humilis TaxID=51915 RepID=A0AAV5S0H2_MAUHU|nr:chromatin-silencing protein [Kazachstania humilis]
MATSAKDLEGWQIVNVDEDGNIIAEGRSRRSRHSSPIYNTLIQRIEDGLSMGRGDNIIAYDLITKTFSVYLIHEIRTNTLNHLVEIWCFQYLRPFELKPERYYKEFNPSVLEEGLSPLQLNNRLQEEIDPNELYLTAELVEIKLKDFIDLAEMVPKSKFDSGKAVKEKDFVVRYICEPDGTNFVKIDIQKEMKYIKDMPSKQSDDHLKRLSTMNIPKPRQRTVTKTESHHKKGNMAHLQSVVVDSSEDDSDREATPSKSKDYGATVQEQQTVSSGDKSAVNGLSKSKPNRTELEISEKDKAEMEKQKNALQTLFDDESQRGTQEQNDVDYEMQDDDDYGDQDIPVTTGREGSASLFVNDASLDQIDRSSENLGRRDQKSDEEPLAKKRKTDSEDGQDSNATTTDTQFTETKSNDQSEVPKTPDIKEKTKTEIPKTNTATKQPAEKSLKASTFNMIKNNYNKTLAMLSNLQKSGDAASESPKDATSSTSQKDVDVLNALKNSTPSAPTEGATKTIMHRIIEMPGSMTLEQKLKTVAEETETTSEMHKAFSELYYSLYGNIMNSTSEAYVFYGPSQLGLEYLIHTVIDELQQSSPADGVELFDCIQVSPDDRCSATNLATQIWKGLTGEQLDGKEALASFLRFAKTTDKNEKKYHVILVSDLERILGGDHGRKIVAMFEKLMKYPNSKMSIIGISSKYNNMLHHIPSSEDKKKWRIVPVFSYPRKGLSAYTERHFQRSFENAFFIHQNQTTKAWSAKNLIVTMTTQQELDNMTEATQKQGYKTLHTVVEPDKMHLIVEYILSKVQHYDDIAMKCSRIIYNAKCAFMKKLSSNQVTPSDQPVISLEFVKEVMDSGNDQNMVETVVKLPAISHLILLTFIHKWTAIALDDENTISLDDFKEMMLDTMQFQIKSGLMKKIINVLCGETKQEKEKDCVEIMDVINWRLAINKLTATGLISTSSVDGTADKGYSIKLCCNPLDLKEALNHVEAFQLP